MSITMYPTLRAFYEDNEQRLRSPEADYGVQWRLDGYDQQWRVSYVKNTGEIYAVHQSLTFHDEAQRTLAYGRCSSSAPCRRTRCGTTTTVPFTTPRSTPSWRAGPTTAGPETASSGSGTAWRKPPPPECPHDDTPTRMPKGEFSHARYRRPRSHHHDPGRPQLPRAKLLDSFDQHGEAFMLN